MRRQTTDAMMRWRWLPPCYGLAFPTLPRVVGPQWNVRCANRDRDRSSRTVAVGQDSAWLNFETSGHHEFDLCRPKIPKL